ncbi:MAG: AmmeMemoRadiSam system protein B, partial [Candidatus Berkelbacteria bacterium]|nr:AmmeMemoRadiSam system protein B [Candidatus Berkelbacteria bacterium]
MKTLKNYKILWYVLLLIVLSALSYFFLQIHRDDPISSIGEVSNTDYVDSLTPNSISTLVVPHHDLVMDKRRAVFTEAAKKTNPKTVILVSPNHFDTGSDLIQTTDRTWTLQDGKLLPDKTKISSLEKSGDAVLSDTAFNGEHGIANILDDIYSTFPNSELVPIIIKPNASKDSIVSLGKELYSLCSSDCLLVASVDDSHYQSGALAELHDDLTIRALNNLDNDLIWQAEVDSNQSLALAINWAKLNSTPKFNLFDHTNSDKLASDRDGESTSYIFG